MTVRARVVWGLLVAWLLVIAWWSWGMGAYSPDSWSYYDMAVSIQEGAPYRMVSVRQFQTPPGIAASFPIGYPLLLAVAEFLIPVGARIGVVVNLALVVASAAVLERFGRTAELRGIGPATLLALCAWPPFAEEIAAGRSMPAAVLTVIGLLSVLRKPGRRAWIASGLLVGLSYLIRFDLLPVTALLVFLLWLDEGTRRWSELALAAATAGAVVGANAIAGLAATGMVISSDNVRTVVSASDVYVRDYFPTPPPTILDDPTSALARFRANSADLWSGTRLALLALLPSVALLLSVRDDRPWSIVRRPALLLAAASVVGVTFGVVTTGYADVRYWSLLAMAVILLLGSVRLPRNRIASVATIGLAAAIGVVHLGSYGATGRPIIVTGPLRADESVIEIGSGPSARRLPDIGLACVDPSARILFPSTGLAGQIAALTRRRTSALPSTLVKLDRVTQEELFDVYGITHVIDATRITDALLLPTRPTRCDGLLELVRDTRGRAP